MSEAPEVRIARGSPTPEQERAAREAILALWRADIAEAERAKGMSAWTVAARAVMTRRSAEAMRARTPGAWRWSGRLGDAPSPIQIGRGDAR